MRVRYAWLTNRLRGRAILGKARGWSLPALLRHGISWCTERNTGVGLAVERDKIIRSTRQFRLSAVGPDGLKLNIERLHYLVANPYSALVIGAELAELVKQYAGFDPEWILKPNPAHVKFHEWRYQMPTYPNHMDLYDDVFNELGVDSLPGDCDLVNGLCDLWPAQMNADRLRVLLAPALGPSDDITHRWEDGRLVLEVGKDAWVLTDKGKQPFHLGLLKEFGVLKYEGFLLPNTFIDILDVGDSYEWPSLECILDVYIEFNQ